MATKLKKIVILGSTGSIGTQALEVIEDFPRRFKVAGLSANTSLRKILTQIKKFKPKEVAMMDEDSALKLEKKLKTLGGSFAKIKVSKRMEGLIRLATLKEADIVLTAVVGSIGIVPTFEAISAKKMIALANKETLISAGAVIMEAARKNKVKIIPVDSEHSAIFQCLMGEERESIQNVILTCSGGPFRKTPLDKLRKVTVKEALNHPSWKMGGKITIDSSTLMNKGFEVIEAFWLFGVPFKNIKVLVHPQSLAHSMVEFKDGSFKAQIGEPTMKIPICLAFSYPKRIPSRGVAKMKLERLNEMTFEKPDLVKFPCLKYAYWAGKIGGTMPAVLNAANEIAVEYFLAGKIKYLDIAQTIKKMMNKHRVIKRPKLKDILEVDRKVKEETRNYLEKL